MKGKLTWVGLILLCCSTLLFAAGTKEQAQDNGPITLTVWDFKYAEAVTGPAFKEMDQMFMAQYPNVTINHVAQPESNYYQLLMSAFTAKSNVDVIISHTDNRAWNLVDFFEVLDPYITDVKGTYDPTALKACSASQSPDSDIRMLPLTAQGMGFYYNKQAFKKAGLDASKAPVSWDDFLAACAALKKAGITPIVLGNSGSTFGIDFVYRCILATLYGDKLSGFSDGTANFTDPEFLKATRMIKSLYDKGYINVENGSISYFMDAINSFKAGNGGFFVGLCSDIAHWKDFGDALGYENVGYFPSPVASDAMYPNAQVNQGAGLGMAVVNYSKNKEMAVKYIESYTSGEGGKVLMDASGAIVPNSSIVVDSSNEMLSQILMHMTEYGVPDYMNSVPGGMVTDFYNFQYLYFISGEISEADYIQTIQKLYKNSL
jgi:ABC-type glycerol-3-phosphate transport system substrate-binding protein